MTRFIRQRRKHDCGIAACAMAIKRSWQTVWSVKPYYPKSGIDIPDIIRMVKRVTGKKWFVKKVRRIPITSYKSRTSRSILVITKRGEYERDSDVKFHYVTQVNGMIYDPAEKKPHSSRHSMFRGWVVREEIMPMMVKSFR